MTHPFPLPVNLLQARAGLFARFSFSPPDICSLLYREHHMELLRQATMYDNVDCMNTAILCDFGLEAREDITAKMFIKMILGSGIPVCLSLFMIRSRWACPGGLPPYQMVMKKKPFDGSTLCFGWLYKRTRAFMPTQCCTTTSAMLTVWCLPHLSGAKTGDRFQDPNSNSLFGTAPFLLQF